MKRDFLTELGLEAETVDKIMAEHGKTLNSHKEKADSADDLQKQIDDYKQQIQDRDKQLKDLNKKAEGNDDLQQTIKDLQKANSDAEAEFEKKLEQQRKESKLEVALRDAKARKPKAVKALLDEESIKLDGDNLLGLDEQIKGLQESDAYLFQEETPPGLEGRTPNPGKQNGGEPPKKNPFTKEHFNLTEQARLMKEEPELYQNLKAQAN